MITCTAAGHLEICKDLQLLQAFKAVINCLIMIFDLATCLAASDTSKTLIVQELAACLQPQQQELTTSRREMIHP